MSRLTRWDKQDLMCHALYIYNKNKPSGKEIYCWSSYKNDDAFVKDELIRLYCSEHKMSRDDFNKKFGYIGYVEGFFMIVGAIFFLALICLAIYGGLLVDLKIK